LCRFIPTNFLQTLDTKSLLLGEKNTVNQPHNIEEKVVLTVLKLKKNMFTSQNGAWRVSLKSCLLRTIDCTRTGQPSLGRTGWSLPSGTVRHALRVYLHEVVSFVSG